MCEAGERRGQQKGGIFHRRSPIDGFYSSAGETLRMLMDSRRRCAQGRAAASAGAPLDAPFFSPTQVVVGGSASWGPPACQRATW